jgi:hypothetical protein
MIFRHMKAYFHGKNRLGSAFTGAVEFGADEDGGAFFGRGPQFVSA